MHEKHEMNIQPPAPAGKPRISPELLAQAQGAPLQPQSPQETPAAPAPAPAPPAPPTPPPASQSPPQPLAETPPPPPTPESPPQTIAPQDQSTPAATPQAQSIPTPQYAYKKAFFLAFFLGVFGADRSYLGYTKLSKIKAATLGGLFLWAWVDALLILLGITTAADGTRLSGRTAHFKLALSVFVGVTLLVIVLLLGVLPMYVWSA